MSDGATTKRLREAECTAPCMGRVPAATQQCRLGPDRSGQKQLVVDTLLHRQPLQLLKDRLDVMAAVNPGDKACCTVLYARKPLQLAPGDAVEPRISHVQPRRNEGVDKALGAVNSQKRANAAYVA